MVTRERSSSAPGGWADGRPVPLGRRQGHDLPNATVALRSVITRKFPPGDYQARAIVQYGGSRPVTADLMFSVDAGEVLAEGVSQEDLARLWVDPGSLELKLRAGAFGAAVMEVSNRGDEPVELVGEV